MITAKGLRRTRGRGLMATFASLILIATAAVSAWAIVDSGLLSPSRSFLDGPLAQATSVEDAALESTGGITVVDNAQLSQPRDPFQPLITPDSEFVGVPGVGGAGGVGDGNGGFTPTTTILLVDIRDVGGVLRATVNVNGESFDVGEGDTFADVYRVISITEDSAVFIFGDNAFELRVGQQVLK